MGLEGADAAAEGFVAVAGDGVPCHEERVGLGFGAGRSGNWGWL